MKPDEAHRVSAPVLASISGLDTAQKNTVLLLLERFILRDQEGNRATIKFGHSDAVNNPPCVICRRPVDTADWSLRLISSWENTQLWITWREYCAEAGEFEIDYDMLTGLYNSPLGYT
jgi:hypothetical protein